MPDALEIMDLFQSLLFDLKGEFRKSIEQSDIPVAPMLGRLLKLIGRRPGITQQDIVVFTRRDKAQVARLVKELLAQDLVRREQDKTDKRAYRLYLLPQGEEIAARIRDMQARVADQFLSNLSAKEMSLLENLLKKIQPGA